MSSVGSALIGAHGSGGRTRVLRSVRIRGGEVDGTTGSGGVEGAISGRGGGSAIDSWSETCRDSGSGSNCAFCSSSLDAADSSIEHTHLLKERNVFDLNCAWQLASLPAGKRKRYDLPLKSTI